MTPVFSAPVNEYTDFERLSSSLARLRPKNCGIAHDLIGHSFCPNPGGDCPHGSDLSIRAALNFLSPFKVLSSTFSHKANILIFHVNVELGALDVGAQELSTYLREGRALPTWISDEIPEGIPTRDNVHAAMKIIQSKAYQPKGALTECLQSVLSLVRNESLEEAKLCAAQFEVRMDLYLQLNDALRLNFEW